MKKLKKNSVQLGKTYAESAAPLAAQVVTVEAHPEDRYEDHQHHGHADDQRHLGHLFEGLLLPLSSRDFNSNT